VLAIHAGTHSIVLSGDVERLGEQQMLAGARLGPTDIVVVPHHGSRTSSSRAFVAALEPRWAVVSAGYRNRWGFPASDVVRRWQEAGAEVLGTAESGAITFEVSPVGPLQQPDRWRIEHPRPWADR
jgi:competence protein ComEC